MAFGVIHSPHIYDYFCQKTNTTIESTRTLVGYYSLSDRSFFILDNPRVRLKFGKTTANTIIHELLHGVDTLVGTDAFMTTRKARDRREEPIEKWTAEYCREIFRKE